MLCTAAHKLNQCSTMMRTFNPHCRLLHLEKQGLGEVGVRSVIYFVRASVANAQLIADQVKELNR